MCDRNKLILIGTGVFHRSKGHQSQFSPHSSHIDGFFSYFLSLLRNLILWHLIRYQISNHIPHRKGHLVSEVLRNEVLSHQREDLLYFDAVAALLPLRSAFRNRIRRGHIVRGWEGIAHWEGGGATKGIKFSLPIISWSETEEKVNAKVEGKVSICEHTSKNWNISS